LIGIVREPISAGATNADDERFSKPLGYRIDKILAEVACAVVVEKGGLEAKANEVARDLHGF